MSTQHSPLVFAQEESQAQQQSITEQTITEQTLAEVEQLQSESAAFEKTEATTENVAVHRVYNPNSGEHFQTMNTNEKAALMRVGWRDEGISMFISNTGEPLYRVYNPKSGEHFFTANLGEITSLKRRGWKDEGIAWHFTSQSGLPVYRLCNPNAKGAAAHHFTVSKGERNALVKAGWRDEAVAWYATAQGKPIPLNFLDIHKSYIVTELSIHEKDRYYLGTPYRGVSSNNPALCMRPGVAMNCTGFVAKALQNAGANLTKITKFSNQWGGIVNAYNWRNTLSVSVPNYTFNNVAELLKSGKAEKGDLLFFEPNRNLPGFDCHIGIFWGNSSKDNRIWHSVGKGNMIEPMKDSREFVQIRLFKM